MKQVLCSIVAVFDYVRLFKSSISEYPIVFDWQHFLGEFDKGRLGSINERSSDCAGHLPFRIFYYFKIKNKNFKRQIRRLQEHAPKGVICHL